MPQEGFKKLKDMLGKAREALQRHEVHRLETSVVRVFAVIGFIAILSAGTWGAVVAVRFAPNAFSSLGAAAVSLTSLFVPAERLTLSLGKQDIASEGEVLVSWVHENPKSEGSYTLTYGCVDGVSVFSPSADGKLTLAFCDTPFNFLSAKDSIRIAVTSDTQELALVPLTLSFTRVGDTKPTIVATSELAVRNEEIETARTAVTGATTEATVTRSRPPAQAGSVGERRTTAYAIGDSASAQYPTGTGVDLVARIIETGSIDVTTNTFVATSTVHASAIVRPAARFIIENLGTAASGPWNFSATLPTLPTHTFTSETQKSLGPNDRIEFTLGFDNFVANESGVGTFTVYADPANSVKEVSEENNVAKADIHVTQ